MRRTSRGVRVWPRWLTNSASVAVGGEAGAAGGPDPLTQSVDRGLGQRDDALLAALAPHHRPPALRGRCRRRTARTAHRRARRCRRGARGPRRRGRDASGSSPARAVGSSSRTVSSSCRSTRGRRPSPRGALRLVDGSAGTSPPARRPPEVATERRHLPGDRPLGVSAGGQVRDVAAQQEPIDVLGSVRAAALGPLGEAGEIAPVGLDGAGGHRAERPEELGVVPRPSSHRTVAAARRRRDPTSRADPLVPATVGRHPPARPAVLRG